VAGNTCYWVAEPAFPEHLLMPGSWELLSNELGPLESFMQEQGSAGRRNFQESNRESKQHNSALPEQCLKWF
jgi:hypothetical protein